MLLTREEQAALGAYSGNAYDAINTALRSGEGMDDKIAATIDLLDSAIAKSTTPTNLVVYRGVGENYARVLKQRELREGDSIVERGFLSTSISVDVARGFLGRRGGGLLLKIRVPAGSNALDMLPYSRHPEEQEILLPRGAELRAVGYDASSDALEFEVV